jgi:3-hydroxy acid dehydrogenase/malonic semialdehyde reductase
MAFSGNGKVAVVTGASSGIGAASAIGLAEAGFRVVLGARRKERLEDVVREIEKRTGQRPLHMALDVTDPQSCSTFVESVVKEYGTVNVLLNNAGLARGTANIIDVTDETDWREMMETNVMGLLRMTRLLLPTMVASGEPGHVINLGSIAGREAYVGGSVYCGSKFAVRAITEALRQELLGKPIRVTEIDPGMVETEFSLVRYHGNAENADQVYHDMTPLTAEDIADCIVFAATRPQHVNIDAMIVKPTDQAGAGKVARHSK